VIRKCLNIKNKKLLGNFTALSLMQGANYIIPLITIPYLVRVLGPEKFGVIAFAQAIIQYFIILTEYGFNLSATRKISVFRNNVNELSKIFSAVMLIKFAFMLIGLVILLFIISLVPRFEVDYGLYLIVYIMVLGKVIFPIWFFQGLEKMKYISIANIGARLIMVIAIFIFIHNESDYLIAAGVQAGSLLLSGLFSMFFIHKVAPIKITIPSVKQLMETLREGFPIFISSASISLYSSTNIFILGLVANNVMVGYFSAAEKIISAIRSLFIPVAQTIYPHINALVAHSMYAALSFIRKIFKWLSLSTLLVSIILFLLAEPIVALLLGKQFMPVVVLIKIMSFIPFIVSISNIFGEQLLLSFQLNKLFAMSIIFPSIFHVILLAIFAPGYTIYAVATIYVFTELFILVFRIVGLYIKHRDITNILIYWKEK